MSAIISIEKMGFPWKTYDPFLFCAHHADAYPKGNDEFGPDKSYLSGRNMGSDVPYNPMLCVITACY